LNIHRANNNLIYIHRSSLPIAPSVAKPVDFTLLNTRSIRNKSHIIKDYVVDHDIDVLALTETWLCQDDDFAVRDICPSQYTFHSAPRSSRGGGVALLHKKMLKFRNQSHIKRKFKSFEFFDLFMSHSNSSLRVVIVYRPPPSKSNKSSLALFFEEFPVLLEQLVTTPSSLLIVGDFNFHVNVKSDTTAKRFSSLLDAFNLHRGIHPSVWAHPGSCYH
jgi:exonuclease III